MGALRILSGLKNIAEGIADGEIGKIAKGAVKTVVGTVEVVTGTSNDSDSDDDNDDD